MQKVFNPNNENESNENLERLSNIEIEERSPYSNLYCITPTDSNQVAKNKNEDRFEKLENRISYLEDLINKELARPIMVLKIKRSPFDNHLDKDIKFLGEEISSKNYIIRKLPENISQINNSFSRY